METPELDTVKLVMDHCLGEVRKAADKLKVLLGKAGGGSGKRRQIVQQYNLLVDAACIYCKITSGKRSQEVARVGKAFWQNREVERPVDSKVAFHMQYPLLTITK
jgi:hypothetical protein